MRQKLNFMVTTINVMFGEQSTGPALRNIPSLPSSLGWSLLFCGCVSFKSSEKLNAGRGLRVKISMHQPRSWIWTFLHDNDWKLVKPSTLRRIGTRKKLVVNMEINPFTAWWIMCHEEGLSYTPTHAMGTNLVLMYVKFCLTFWSQYGIEIYGSTMDLNIQFGNHRQSFSSQ